MGNNLLRIITVFWIILCGVSTAQAQNFSGAYLAARQANMTYDFQSAAEYYDTVLTYQPHNTHIMQQAIAAYISAGRFDAATELAVRLNDGETQHPFANVVLMVQAFETHDYAAALDILKQHSIISDGVDPLLKAWALIGMGDSKAGFAIFKESTQNADIQGLALYQTALAHLLAGDLNQANDIIKGKNNPALRPTVRTRLVENEISNLLAQNGSAKSQVIRDISDAVSEIFYILAPDDTNQSRQSNVALFYLRLSHALNHDNAHAVLRIAGVLDDMQNPALANDTYAMVPKGHPNFVSAEIGRAETLIGQNDTQGGLEILTALRRDYPQNIPLLMSLGILHREMKNYEQSVIVYSDIIELLQMPRPDQWRIFFGRGIAHERANDWRKAEIDFRAALALNPDQPLVLNYLGYTLVDRNEKLEEALQMIRTAVEQRPDAGFIVDSLGWALYRLGDYEQSVQHLEKAAEIMATDPVINDHLGDAYWQVGRKAEARFQWRRAASFGPEENLADTIADKLKHGLTGAAQ